ncbi:MAG: 4-hydroxythreonine-4-phosphate dehydrogenase PdxA [Myxococcota bacterium]
MAPSPIVITHGMGIGPEITRAALAQQPPSRPVVLMGRSLSGVPAIASLSDVPTRGVVQMTPSDAEEPVEVAAIRAAAAACLAGDAVAMVTGPIHKKKLANQGFTFMGHTDFLGELCGVDEPVMAFVGGELKVALVTTHMPLMAVGRALTVERIRRVVRLAHQALARDLGMAAPRLAVCGLNPHAGEDGLLGCEELEIIGPACDAIRADGLPIRGPVSAETAFLEARLGRVDLIVAMYHDQGLAPLKLVDFGRSVNWTLGLPIIRTSVDHGTADHLVGTGEADPASMMAAVRLAMQVADRREISSGQ